MFQDFDKIGNVPDKHSITFEPNILPVQYKRCTVPTEAREEIET